MTEEHRQTGRQAEARQAFGEADGGDAREQGERPPSHALLHALLAAETIQRPALARTLGVPRHTVSDLVAALEARGLVHVSGAIDGRPGRSTHSYRLNPRAAVALAATGRGGALHAVLVDLRGTLIAEAAAPCAFDEPESVWRGLSALAHRLCADASLEMFRLRATLLLLPLEKTHDALQGQLQAALGCPVTVNSATPEGSAEPPATLEGVLERARSALLAAVVEEIEGTAGW